MATGMFASIKMARNWEDAFMHATTMMLAKINAWTSLKLANSTALARYGVQTFSFLVIFQENCPGGCPCDDYPCAETTTAPDVTTPTAPATTTSPATNAVLVLSTKNAANKAMVIDWDGEFIFGNKGIKSNHHIQVTTMMISVLNMALVQLFTVDVERPLWDSFGILVAKEMPTSAR